jgi:hypothetical protein
MRSFCYYITLQPGGRIPEQSIWVGRIRNQAPPSQTVQVHGGPQGGSGKSSPPLKRPEAGYYGGLSGWPGAVIGP